MRRSTLAIGALAAVFSVKAALFALFVTPLWDVPDESGHFGIVQDIADGKGLPLPHRSKLPENVLRDWMRAAPAEPMDNWAAQHPPLYHALAAPFLMGARLLTHDPWWLFRAPRIFSALCGGAALLLFHAAFLAAGADPALAFFSAAGVAFLPTYTHMASGTSHDIFVALLAGAAALFWVRLIGTARAAGAVGLGLSLGAMGLTKLSALPVAAALVLVSIRPLAAGRRRALPLLAIVSALAFLPPAAWAVRQWLLVGNARLHPISRVPFDAGAFLAYLRGYPVVDHSFKNFVGLVGWTGSGGGLLRWMQISGPYLAVYLGVALLAAAATAVWLLRRNLAQRRFASIAVAAALFLFGVAWLFASADGSALPKRVLYALAIAIPVAALAPAFSASEEDRPVLGSHVVYAVFGLAYLVNSWEGYEIYGQMRATNGRYFFAVLPFLAIAFVFPAARLIRDRRRRDLALAAVVAALLVTETLFFLFAAIPFYRSGPFSR
jgi:hypothetical protein